MAVTPSTARRAILRDAIGIAVPTGAYATSFGALSTTAGLSVLQTCALSALMFTGASQFAFIAIATTGGTPLSAAATATLLGVRNALYGLRLSALLGVRGPRRLATAHFVIDETTGMAIARDTKPEARYAFWATGVALFMLWNLGTLIGALAGEALSDPKVYGLDVAAPAAYLALLAPQMKTRAAWVTGLAAAAVALALVPLVPVGVPVMLAGLVAIVVGVIRPTQDGSG